MSELKVIFLGPACQEQGQSSGREWCQDDVWDTCECGHESVRYVLGSELDRVTAERERLTAIIESYPNGDPLQYDAAVRKIQQ